MRTVRTLIKIIFRFSSESIALLIKVAENLALSDRDRSSFTRYNSGLNGRAN